jgi:hypothetical protein
MADWVSAG